MKAAKKILGVWFDKTVQVEDDKIFKHLFDLNVDMICTDYPLQALSLIDAYLSLKSYLCNGDGPIQP